jgi:outer membrane immunogenic protein
VFAAYRYTSFGSSTISLPFSQLTTSSTTNVKAVEFGVNYKFNSGAPSAVAATAPYTRPPAPALVCKSLPASYAYDWTAFYLGGDGGYGWGTANGTLTDVAGVPLTPYNYRANGPLAGLFIGGNYQFNKFVVGVEGDWQWSNLIGNNQTLAPLGATGAFPSGPFTVSTTVKDYASIRGRLGVAFGRFLVFGTGGLAWGNPSTSYALTGAAPFVTNGGNSTGWTAGAGVEYAFTDSVFGRIEYRYTNLRTAGFVKVARPLTE